MSELNAKQDLQEANKVLSKLELLLIDVCNGQHPQATKRVTSAQTVVDHIGSALGV